MPKRFDIATLEKPQIDHNGFLTAKAVLTRTGVFEYRRADGTRTRELRAPEEVFNKDSLETLTHRPFTDGHPVQGRVTAKNARQLQRGMVISNPEVDGNLVRADILVTDQGSIDKIMREKNPVRAISCGYDIDLVKKDGEFEGERFDHEQTKIIYNHVALVPRGRAGPEARLRVDADDGAVEDIDIELDETDKHKTEHKEDHVMTIRIKRDAIKTTSFKQDAFVVTVTDDDAEEGVKPALLALDAAIAHIKVLEGDLSEQRGRIDELVEKAELPPEKLTLMGQERADLLGVAYHVGLSNVETLRNDEIKKTVVHTVSPKLNLDGPEVDQSYINGRYDSIVANIQKNHKAVKSMAELRQIARTDDYRSDDDEEEFAPRDKFKADTENMWMGEEERKQLNS